MSTQANVTTPSNPSPEFVRRSLDGGLELVRAGGGIECTAPVQVTAKREGNRIIVGLEARPIVWNINGQFHRVLEVQNV
jgi:hypothetical protein